MLTLILSLQVLPDLASISCFFFSPADFLHLHFILLRFWLFFYVFLVPLTNWLIFQSFNNFAALKMWSVFILNLIIWSTISFKMYPRGNQWLALVKCPWCAGDWWNLWSYFTGFSEKEERHVMGDFANRIQLVVQSLPSPTVTEFIEAALSSI